MQTQQKLSSGPKHSEWYNNALEELVVVVQELSHCRDIDAVAAIVRRAARELTGADGASFILRDGDFCFYADENAIAPLWKGKRFPMQTCVSGWVMNNAQSTTIEDIYKDPRVPYEAYRPTFVKSMAMVPIRRNSPIGAIGNYWANTYQPSDEEVAILQALADTTSVALENVELYNQLQNKVKALQESNEELGHFAWVASHDLQEPLRTISIQMELLKRFEGDKLTDRGNTHIDMAVSGAERLQRLIKDLLTHAAARQIKEYKPVDLNVLMDEVKISFDDLIEKSGAQITYDNLPTVFGDPVLLLPVMMSLVSNAIKFSKQEIKPRIHISAENNGHDWIISVTDNGIGIDEQYLVKIFDYFQRLHSRDKYEGSGLGLATAKRIIEMHGGKIWAENLCGGSVFKFTIPLTVKNREFA